jgi:DNA-binding FrmR family transcriptional regulator
MSHLTRPNQALLGRIRIIRGQIQSVEGALENGETCLSALNTVAACRGAINSLMAEMLEQHIKCLMERSGSSADCDEVLTVLKTYLR